MPPLPSDVIPVEMTPACIPAVYIFTKSLSLMSSGYRASGVLVRRALLELDSWVDVPELWGLSQRVQSTAIHFRELHSQV